MQLAQSYIYILAIVGYIIYSIVKSAKKVTDNRPTIDSKPEQLPPVSPPTSSPLPNSGDDMKKMLEELFGRRQEEKTPEVVIPKPQPQPLHKKPLPHTDHSKNPSHVFDKSKTAAGSERHTAEKPKPAPKKVLEEPVIAEEVPDFDIRQAIVYSEILKRPQY